MSKRVKKTKDLSWIDAWSVFKFFPAETFVKLRCREENRDPCTEAGAMVQKALTRPAHSPLHLIIYTAMYLM